jgi:hypothetical protein
MKTIKYLRTICEQHTRIEGFTNAKRLPNVTMAKVNHALSMIAHLLDELEQPHYNSAYMERQLVDLTKRVNIIEEELLC